MKKDEFHQLKEIYTTARQDLISSVDRYLNPDYTSRCSSLFPHALATLLADAALGKSSEKTRQWIEMNAKGWNLFGTPLVPREVSPLMCAACVVLETICGFSLPPEFEEKIPPIEDIMKQLAYPYSHDTSYVLPFHRACMALLCTMKGFKVPQLLQTISDHQQPDGSWIDDTTITAMSALALQQGGVEPTYDFKKWLEEQQLPDGSWAAANGEVWEAAYALRTGVVSDTARLVSVLVESMHSNYWWGFSRYSVPDVDDMSAACYALAPYEPRIAAVALTKLGEVQDEDGGWGAFPYVEGVIPHESVVAKARESSSEITCHAVEAFEQNNKKGSAFKRGISYLLETQEQDGHWKSPWWNSDIYATQDSALLLKRNDYEKPVFHALDWLEATLDGQKSLNIVEYALLIGAFSTEYSDYYDSLNRALDGFLERYKSESLAPTFDIIYFGGLLDLKIYRLSVILLCLDMFQREYIPIQ